MIQLQPRERLVLWSIQHRPDEPLAVIAKELKLKESVVRAAVTKFFELGLIHRIALINYLALGYTEYLMYLNLNAASGKLRDAFVKHCVKDERVSRIEELGGVYDYSVAFLARHAQDATQFLEGFDERIGGIVGQSTVSVLHSYTGFGRKYLTGRVVKPTVVIGGVPPSLQEVDDLDHRILRTLADDGDLSQRDLARHLGEQVSKVSFRISRLRDKNIIQGFVYGVRASKLPVLRYRFIISGAAMSRSFRESLERFFAEHPHIVNMTRNLGAWNYMVQVEVPAAKDAFELAHDIRGRFGEKITSFGIFNLFGYQKNTMYPFRGNPTVT